MRESIPLLCVVVCYIPLLGSWPSQRCLRGTPHHPPSPAPRGVGGPIMQCGKTNCGTTATLMHGERHHKNHDPDREVVTEKENKKYMYPKFYDSLCLLPTRRWVQMSFVSSPEYVPPFSTHNSFTLCLALSSRPVTVMVWPLKGGQQWAVMMSSLVAEGTWLVSPASQVDSTHEGSMTGSFNWRATLYFALPTWPTMRCVT